MAVIASYQCNYHAKFCDTVTTSNHNTSERGEGWEHEHEHEDVVFLGARRNHTTQVHEPCDRFCNKDADNSIKDEDVVTMKGFGTASKKYSKSSSDSDNNEYEFQDK